MAWFLFQETVVFLQVLGRIIGSRGEKGGCSGHLLLAVVLPDSSLHGGVGVQAAAVKSGDVRLHSWGWRFQVQPSGNGICSVSVRGPVPFPRDMTAGRSEEGDKDGEGSWKAPQGTPAL